MNNRKDIKSTDNEQNKKVETEENYGFIKEERVPQRKWQKRYRILRSILVIIMLGVLFGIIARSSYEISDYVIQRFFSKDEKKPIEFNPSPTGPGNLGGDTPVIDDKAFQSYEQIMKGVRDASTALEPSMVRVIYEKNIVDPVFADITSSTAEMSGVIVGDNGSEYLILTAYEGYESFEHDKIYAAFSGGKTVEARVLAKSEEADLLLLAVNYKEFRVQERDWISVIKLGKSGELTLGSVVIAIGFPNGRGKSVDMGILTSRSEKVYITDLSLEIMETNMLGGRGESGILVNAKGEMVGFISNRFHEQCGCIEALSIDKLSPLLQLMANDTAYPRFGAVFADISEKALSQISIQNGIIIESVKEESVAAEHQFRKGDILTKLDGVPVTSVEEFFLLYTNHAQGDEIEVQYYRNGKEMKKSWKISY